MAQMQAHALMILEAFARAGADFKTRVEAFGHKRDFLVADHMTARDLGAFGTAEIHRDAPAPAGTLHRLAVNLQTAHAKHVITG